MELLLGPLTASFVFGITAILLFYWYSIKKHAYWKEKGVPYVQPYPFVGSAIQNMTTPLHDVELQRHFQYGKVYGHYEGTRAVLSVADPVLLRAIMVKDFFFFTGRRPFSTGDKVAEKLMSVLQGEDWKRVRTIVTPTFSTGKLKRMMSIFKDCAKTLVNNFKIASENGGPVEVKRVYGAFTMDVIASSAFSTKIDSHNDPDNQFVKTARFVFMRNINWRSIVFTLCPGLMKLLRISVFAPSVMKFFCSVTYQIIEERRRTGQTRNDFLQLLMDTAKDVEKEKTEVSEKESEDITENYGEDETNYNIFRNNYSKKHLSFNELAAQCLIFFLAGYDTTASTLSFATYFLALHEDVQDKLREEVDEALKEHNGELTYEAMQSMKYLDNVISETLRIYPPAVRTERVADADYSLGDTGITIPKGMLITIPIYAIHRDPNFYPEPEKFDPERFSADQRAKRDQYTYIPFGAGPRNCVAMRFALMEIKVCLTYLTSHFRIKRCPQTKVPLDFYIGQGLLQPKDIMVLMEVRKDCPLSDGMGGTR